MVAMALRHGGRHSPGLLEGGGRAVQIDHGLTSRYTSLAGSRISEQGPETPCEGPSGPAVRSGVRDLHSVGAAPVRQVPGGPEDPAADPRPAQRPLHPLGIGHRAGNDQIVLHRHSSSLPILWTSRRETCEKGRASGTSFFQGSLFQQRHRMGRHAGAVPGKAQTLLCGGLHIHPVRRPRPEPRRDSPPSPGGRGPPWGPGP